MAFFECNFFSKAINIFTAMNVILPEDDFGRDYPTLYLLHGYTDNHTAWTRWSSIERYAREYNLAVVMPDVQKSFYNDFPGINDGYKYWKFVSEELIETSRRFFRLSHNRKDTFVAGLSMGGFGAFKCALNRPDIFSAAASLSGAVDWGRNLRNNIGNKEHEMIMGDLSKFDGSENDLFSAAEKTSKLAEKPRLYQYCGTEDFLYEGNIKFRDFIKNLGYDYTYEESPGDHQWKYWDKHIEKFIGMLSLEGRIVRA
ncbi:MAG: esterase family protein [Oscillospiraceae bacterium]|nr:esterase family protein [Oscillospiraceae bacterium]